MTKLFKDESKPYEFQKEGARFALSNFYTLNRDEPGLGKTIQALLAICWHLEKEPNDQILVVCPQYLRANWKAEIEEWTDLTYHLFDQKSPMPLWGIDIVLISYDQLKYFPSAYYFEPLYEPKKKCRLQVVVPRLLRKYRPLSTLCDARFNFIVADETHNFKNPKAKRTVHLTYMVDHLKPLYLMLLSGTPIKNRLYDLFTSLFLMAMSNKVGKKITDKYRTYFLFCYRFCEVVKTRYGTQFRGRKNVDELKTYLEGRVIGRKKADMLELPKAITKNVVVDYKENPALLEEYEAFQAGVQGVTGTVKRDSAILTAPFTAEYCEDLFEQDVGPILVYSEHPDAVHLIAERLKKIGRVAVVVGGIGSKRDKIYEDFKAGLYDFWVASRPAASEGLNLTRSHNMVINDLPWTPTDLKQMMDRIDRIGQEESPMYHIITGPVVGKKIWKSLKEKLKTITAVFD